VSNSLEVILTTIYCKKQKFDNIKGIIFDKDGTLEDSQSFLREVAYKRVRTLDAQIPGIGELLLMAFGVQDNKLDPTGLIAVGSRRENEIAAAAYIAETGRSWFESLAIAQNAFVEVDKYLSRQTNTSPLFAGSLEVLKFLSEGGLKLGILSADTSAGIQAFVDRHQLSSYIQMIMGVDRGLSKPDPALFLLACQELGVEPKATIMVGDSQGDIEMAKAAGAAGTIGICWGNPQALHLENADVAIARLDEIQIVEN
jgi:phosphoglycolate phosphatase